MQILITNHSPTITNLTLLPLASHAIFTYLNNNSSNWRRLTHTTQRSSSPAGAGKAKLDARSTVPTPAVLVLSTVAFTLQFAVWLMFGVLGVPIQKEMGLTNIELGWLGAMAVLAGVLPRLLFWHLDRLMGAGWL